MNDMIRFLALSMLTFGWSVALADDWPQWMGPERDAIWREAGIIESIPDDGLPVKWRAKVGIGYGGPAVVGDRVFVMDYVVAEGEVTNNPGGATALQGKERVLCLSAQDGSPIWEHAYDQPYNISYPGGPRCTPTVADGKVYTCGAEGEFRCLDAGSGKLVWKKTLPKEYSAKTPIWGYASHPLVDGDFVFVIAGGPGSECVALQKDTGKEVWRAMTASEPGYGPPTMIEHAGRKQLLIWHPDAINGLDPATGKVYWSLPIKAGFGMSINAPRKLDNLLYISAIGDVSALIRLSDDEPGAEFVWQGKSKTSVYCSNSTPFLMDGIIYGCDIETGALMAARLSDGERLWQTTEPTDKNPRRSRHATAFLVKHEQRFFLFNELGDLILALLSPDGYIEQGRFHVLEPTNEAFGRPVVWSHPAFANKSMFARNDKELVCVDLATK
jgi:outer membrane protein assembly factor BamB